MTEPAEGADPWVDRLRADGPQAAAELFTAYRSRLRRLVQLRMDPRLSGRIDPSDVLQEAFLDVAARATEYAAKPDLPVYLWLRLMTAQRLAALHRRHLTAKKRDAAQEIPIHAVPPVSTESLAAKLLGRDRSPDDDAARGELRDRLVILLDALDPIDREVVVLRHFEELTNSEVATVLGVRKAAASNRYTRAIKRLRQLLGDDLSLFDGAAAP
jgi:RNA polymerase sigma-70 factor (ECF subfamily)